MYPPGLSVPHETSSAPVLDTGVPGSVGLGDEDMFELVPVLLAQEKKTRELDLKERRWQTKEGKHIVAEGFRKKTNSLVEDTALYTRVTGKITPSAIEFPRPHSAATTGPH